MIDFVSGYGEIVKCSNEKKKETEIQIYNSIKIIDERTNEIFWLKHYKLIIIRIVDLVDFVMMNIQILIKGNKYYTND